MYFGKMAFDPGHCAGANPGPAGYYEGDAMLQFGLELQKAYDCFLTRTTGKNLDLKQRGLLAKNAGCDAMISLHTNAPQAASGVIIFYPVSRPQDKPVAEALGKELAKAMGITFRGAKTRTFSDGKTDYYGVIRDGLRAGLKTVFIVEHGSHWEFAVNTKAKIAACVEVYGKFFEMPAKAMTYEQALQVLSDMAGISVGYWATRKDIDRWFEKFVIDLAKGTLRLKEGK